MPMIPVRDLARRTREVLDDVQRTGRVAIVTRQGRPAVAIIPLDADDLEDFVLAGARDFLDAMKEADEDLAAGLTRPLDELITSPPRSRSERKGDRSAQASHRSFQISSVNDAGDQVSVLHTEHFGFSPLQTPEQYPMVADPQPQPRGPTAERDDVSALRQRIAPQDL